MRAIFLLLSVVLSPASPAAAEEPSVKGSTEAARPVRVEDLYGGLKLRDPFRDLTKAGGGMVAIVAAKEFDPEEFSIHAVDLKGVMKDRSGTYAVLVDGETGMGFILREGKLFDYKNNRIPKVTGRINVPQKTVILMTPDKDVQTLRLGEEGAEDVEDEE
ncbi:MAG: hypothetical protein ABII00_08620 [Elusimicrobiota bacterium]